MNLISPFISPGQAVRAAKPFAGGDSSRRPWTADGGFTLVEVMVVVAVIGLLAAIAVPAFAKSRHTTRVRTCINSLIQIDRAKQEWALENRKSDTDTPTTDQVAAYLKDSRLPHCPESGTYRIRRVARDPACSKSSIGHALTNENGDDDPLAD